MKLHYFKSAVGNFGDDINLWLWDRLMPGCWDLRNDVHFAGIGTILTESMPIASNWIVLGTGAGYGPPPRGFGGPGWSVLSVRGPFSARVLGLPPEKAVTDGALLLNQLPEFEPLPESERGGTIFVPHYQALETGAWPEACRRASIECVDPRDESNEVINRLRRARLVIADSMHAAIVADTLRVPWVPVATSLEINSFKWMDWTQSMGVPYEPVQLPSSTISESFRSQTLRLHGQQYFVNPPSEAGVMRHYKRALSMKTRPWWPYAQRSGEKFYSALVRRTARVLDRNTVLNSLHEGRIDAAAAILRRLAAGPSYLSTDTMWRRRTEQLTGQVDTLRRFLH